GPVEDGQFLGITKNFPSSGTITAVFEDASAEDIVFFSNPTESYLNGTYRASGTTHVRIYSPQGQLILDRELFHNEGEHLINLALTAIPAGVYLFEVVSELGKRTKRFVKL
ncbi:MAG: T9SS type A sorting domain-containing protein, partial [Flavobacteriales bacterium]|nr:T9SS type A sorting domain-containing protein [Flavobacteriales bacterium]